MRLCAAPDCDNPVRTGRGRPAIYCSPPCRPSWRSPRSRRVVVELTNPEVSPDGRPVERVWTVRLRRREVTVTVAEDLGWPSASALAAQLETLLYPPGKEGGAAG